MPTPEFRVKLVLDEAELQAGFSRADVRSADFVKNLTEQASQAGSQVSRLSGSMQAASSGGLSAARKGMAGVGDATKMTRQEILALNYTASDVAASLASGASPFTILLQQGGQVRDQFGGFGNLFTKVTAAITPVGFALTAVGTAATALAVATYKGYQEQESFNKSLRMTGNYAGLTNDSLAEMSKRVANHGQVSTDVAREMVVALSATGRVSAGAIEPVAKSAALYAKVTGQSADQVAQDFATMGDGVTKWAQEHNKRYHFLSVAQLQYIRSLEDQGRVEQAQVVVSDALFNHLAGKGVDSLGLLGRAWLETKNAASEYWDVLKGIGRDETASEEIARLEAAVKKNKDIAAQMRAGAVPAFGAMSAKDYDQQAQNFQDQLDRKREDRLRANAAARDQANRARAQELAAAADTRIQKLAEETKGQSLLNKKIEEYRKDIEAIRLAGGAVPSAQEQQADIARLREQFNPKGAQAGNSLAKAARDRAQAFEREGARLDEIIRQYKEYGHAVEATARVVLETDLKKGELKGLGSAAANALRAQADAEDAKKRQVEQLGDAGREVERTQKRVAAIKELADAQALSNREARIARELATINTEKLPKGSADYKRVASELRAAANADEDRLLAMRLRDQSRGTDDEVARLNQETQALGQNTLQRQIATYALKLEADARKEIANSPDKAGAINSAKLADLAKYTSATTDAYNKQRDAVTGLRKASMEYSEQVTNGSQFAADFFKGSVTKMEDALVNFAKTGKANFSDLFQFMADEFIRQQARMLIAKATGGSDGLFGLALNLAGAFAGGSGSGSAAGATGGTDYGLSTGGGGFGNGFKAPSIGARVPMLAAGGDPYLNRINLVGERGPELFVPRVPGTILPNSALRGMTAPSVSVVQHNQIGSTMGRAELEAGMSMAKEAAVSEVFDRLRRMGVMK